MRAALLSVGLLSTGLPVAAPAFAQSVECYASESKDKIGEVTISFDVETATGKVKSQTLSWTPERTDGEESEYFARPNLTLDYELDEAGALSGPSTAQVLVTKMGSGGPSMRDVRVRVTVPDYPPWVWTRAEQGAGEKIIARLLREKKPAKLTADVLDKSDKVLASAVFDFGKAGEASKLAAKAKATGEKRLAAYQAAVAAGNPPASCPIS